MGCQFAAGTQPALHAFRFVVAVSGLVGISFGVGGQPVLAAERVSTPWAEARAAGFENGKEREWSAWVRKEDKTIRARLEQGDLDSMVNLLLFGTSFTREPRIAIEKITEGLRSGVLRARVDDLVAGLKNPGKNERLAFLRGLLASKGFDVDGAPSDAGVFLYKNLQRVLEEKRSLAERATKVKERSQSVLDRGSLFQDRGVSLDTNILPDYAIEQTLRDLKQRGVLGEGKVLRAGVIGPGLDFSDKNAESSYDYYPQQTVQPFALFDSLIRLGLAKPNQLSLSVLDISTRVLDHVRHAREAASKNAGYVIQLPRDVARPWPADLVAYWGSFGDQVGSEIQPIPPPKVFAGLETRAVRVRPEVVLACEPVDLDIVVERLRVTPSDGFDLLIGTNIFLYYDTFEQMLALENAGAMLKPGGLLLTNDKLPEVRGGSMKQAGMTVVRYNGDDLSAREAVGWYQKAGAH